MAPFNEMIKKGIEDGLYSRTQLEKLVATGLSELVSQGSISEADKTELTTIANDMIVELGGTV